jgi:hypothetical protein
MTTEIETECVTFQDLEHAKAMLVWQLQRAIAAVEAGLVNDPIGVGVICRTLATVSDVLPKTLEEPWANELCDMAWSGDAEYPVLLEFLMDVVDESSFELDDDEEEDDDWDDEDEDAIPYGDE